MSLSSVVLIANGAAYGHESLFNALRLAITLKEQQSDLDLKLFLMSDAVVAGLAGQQPREGYHLQQMLEILTAQQVPVKLCKTCADARGVSQLPLRLPLAHPHQLKQQMHRCRRVPTLI